MTTGFWRQIQERVDPTAYRPLRQANVEVARLEAHHEPYYVLKQPQTRTYLRLSEADYALWWLMDGQHSVKDLLFYCLKRYRSLPIGRLNSLIADLRNGRFLQDTPTNLYEQLRTTIAAYAPANRGRKLLDAFMDSEISRGGFDPAFTLLHRLFGWLYVWPVQMVLLLVILVGGVAFSRLFLLGTYPLSGQGGWSIFSIIAANLVIIGIHEVAHGLTVKHYGRELNRCGALIYWGFPAFFVDTRDIWLSPRRARIAVSWAGPHSGLLVGALSGLALTWIATNSPDPTGTFGAIFLYQLGFLAYLSVFVNLNPLLELDGYFILMDWLEMPGLRQRAFAFWRETIWAQRGDIVRQPRHHWQKWLRTQRILLAFGALALAYSTYALVFAVYFWQTRLVPLLGSLWRDYGGWGQALVLLLTAGVIIPAVYFLLQYGWAQVRAGLEWLARRDLLGRSDVLALLLGSTIFIGLPLAMLGLAQLPRAEFWLTLLVWLLHLAVVLGLVVLARQLPGSRFQWAVWALVAVPAGLTLAWIATEPFWSGVWLTVSGVAVALAGGVAWFTAQPKFLQRADWLVMGVFLVMGLGTAVVLVVVLALPPAMTLAVVVPLFLGLIGLSPLLVNFAQSRFGLAWLLLVLGMVALPWLLVAPLLHVPVLALWLFAVLLYVLLGALAEFRLSAANAPLAVGAFDERERLVYSFNHFVAAMFASYEAVFGGRRLAMIQAQMQALGAIDPDDSILDIAERCETALLLAVDRLDDLAGTPFTLRVGQAAYDTLSWLEAETLARHVLAETEWGVGLARSFGQMRDRRGDLVRQADIFAGFDEDGVAETLAIAQPQKVRAGVEIAREGSAARHFYLVESGTVAVVHDGVQVGVIEPGGYFGMLALLDAGDYLATYRAETAVSLLAIARDRFDPLLRADTTLSSQVRTGAAARKLLKQMPLFASLSPQQLTAVAARMTTRDVAAGEVIVRQGQPRAHLFVVAEGVVQVVVRDGDTEERVGDLGAGEHFGEYALFADTPYQATYTAVQDSQLLLLDEPTFDRLVANYETMSHYVEQIGTGRLIATQRRLGLTAVIS